MLRLPLLSLLAHKQQQHRQRQQPERREERLRLLARARQVW
jgi:hypothetical protein